ncbi:50S ribosomal protein L3 [Candidatus Woesearchaeota archaeon]|nr:50S ribosomal protein L3 [Candidatus Woesearchaeota archaeon]USN44843.1 MAG: 50S ribosomal protein L3 [Candidatus Woesearchaeota archaeon]
MGAPSTRKRGSKQYWPRVRAGKQTPVVNAWNSKILPKETGFLGFPAYKVGMTSVGVIDNFSHTLTKGTEINVPVTVLECPPVRVLSLKLLAYDEYENLQIVKEISAAVKDKHLAKKIDLAKKAPKVPGLEEVQKLCEEHDVEEVRIKISTQPSHTGIGKKKPDVLELALSGNITEQLTFALAKLGTEIKVSDVFQGGELVDSHGVTTGKGFQGAVKRFGVKLTSHKSEKKRRHAGNVGAWTPSRVSHTIPLPGQHGYHERTEWNKWIIKVSAKPEDVNPKQGFLQYGEVRSEYLLVKGSIQGPRKRMVTLVRATRPNKRYPKVAPQITYISK